MRMNKEAIMANMGTFSHAYGLKPKSGLLLNALKQIDNSVTRAGLMLRNPVNKKALLSCQFPIDAYYTDQMIWVIIDNVEVEAVPIFAADIQDQGDSNQWKKYHHTKRNREYDIIHNGAFSLTVHHMLRKKGRIDLFYPHKGFGFIKKKHRDLFFKQNWCKMRTIKRYQDVSFFPVISKKGLEARNIS